MEFGNSEDSRVQAATQPKGIVRSEIRLWAVNQIADRAGNYITFGYSEDQANGTHVPTWVSYGGNLTAGQTAYAVVQPVWQTRSDVETVYEAGSQIRTAQRLDHVNVFNDPTGTTVVKAYYLTYEAALSPSTNRSRLANVQECADAARTSCLNPTNISWQNGANGWTAISSAGPNSPFSNRCLTGDLNGDGKTDMFCNTGGGVWDVRLSNGIGWTQANWAGGPSLAATSVPSLCVTADVNGDGKTDLMCQLNAGGSWSNWTISLSTGTGWNTSIWANGPALNGTPISRSCFTTDLNGDGKTDMACYTGAGGNWHVVYSSSTGWLSTGQAGASPGTPIADRCLSGDFNGDGKTDMACYTGAGGIWDVRIANGSGWNQANWGNGPDTNTASVAQWCATGDLNGDGKTDVLCQTGVGGIWYISLSTGTSWTSSSWVNGPQLNGSAISNSCFVVDFSGDGKTDIACWTGVGGSWYVGYSTGTSWISTGQTGHHLVAHRFSTVAPLEN